MGGMRLRLLLATAGTLHIALACSCAGPNPICSSYWTTPLLFLGRAIRVEHLVNRPQPNLIGPGEFLTHFAVSKLYRGMAPSEIVVHTSDQGSACGMGFEEGHQYLVFAYPAENGDIGTNHCTATHEVLSAAADADVQWIEGLPHAPHGGVIFGNGARLLSKDDGTYESQALSGLRVSLRGPQSRNIATDAEGNFRAEGLAPGTYVVSAPAQPGYEAFDERKVTVRDRSCSEVDWRTVADAHIRGRAFFADGSAASGIVMTAQKRGADGEWNSGANIITTAADGSFDFGRLDPGAWVFGVNLDFGPLDDKSYYRRVFFPGAANRSGAEVIALATGQLVDALRFYLPPDAPPPAIPMRVTVTGSDGQPAAHADVLAYDEMWENSVTPVNVAADENGTATLMLRPGSHYDVEAVVTSGDGSQSCAGPARVEGRDDAPPLSLSIAHPVGNCMQFRRQ